MIANPTERFTGRVESYRRYRPGYPTEIAGLLRRECGLSSESTVADVAAGTGLLTKVLLAAGLAVTAVEPNDEMRAVCETLEREYPRLRCVKGTAETTGLDDASVDLITVAQAMHWFDLEKTRAEFARVLRPGGSCAVIYNNRHPGGDAFHEQYEQFLREHGIDYLAVKDQHMERHRLAQFFAPQPISGTPDALARRGDMECVAFANAQPLGFEALRGRVLSSSYIPQPGDPRYPAMEAALRKLFAEHAQNGVITMRYDCVVCWGVLTTPADASSAH